MAGTVTSVVDDDVLFRAAVERLFRSTGFSVHAFASAQDFLLSPRLNDTSCLIVDVEMPGMSGVDLQERLIALGNKTPLIFMTAFPTDRIRDRVVKAGAIGFFTKPFDESQLLDCVDLALRGRSPK